MSNIKNNASMRDIDTLISAGIDPKTGLPIRAGGGGGSKCFRKEDAKLAFRIMDEQNAVNRYTWYNLPKGLSSEIIERILYYRGQGAFFRLQDKFYFLPYTMSAPQGSTGIDVYGRFTGITPLPFNGGTSDDKEAPWIRGLIYEPVYEPIDPLDYIEKSAAEVIHKIEGSCVLLHDYTPQRSQINIPRQAINDPLLDLMSECLPFMRTSLLNSTGITGMRVQNENEVPAVEAMSNAINRCALEGKKYAAVVGNLDFQELTGGEVAKAEEFFLALQSLDNLRLSFYGLDNGGLFQKKSHMLEAEQEMNAGNTGLVAEDGLRNRQYAALIFNSIFGTQMWVEPSECIIGVDRDGDLVAGNDGEAATAQKTAVAANKGGEEE